MATSHELNQLFTSTSNLATLGDNHTAAGDSLRSQTIVVGNTAEQLVAGYTLYGLENDLESASLAASEIPGVTTESSGLTEPDPSKLVAQPYAGDTLIERENHFGHHPPVPGEDDGLAKPGDLVTAGIGSILPWTPHPQHSYKDNATRVVNRTGRKRPTKAKKA